MLISSVKFYVHTQSVGWKCVIWRRINERFLPMLLFCNKDSHLYFFVLLIRISPNGSHKNICTLSPWRVYSYLDTFMTLLWIWLWKSHLKPVNALEQPSTCSPCYMLTGCCTSYSNATKNWWGYPCHKSHSLKLGNEAYSVQALTH